MIKQKAFPNNRQTKWVVEKNGREEKVYKNKTNLPKCRVIVKPGLEQNAGFEVYWSQED